MNTATHPPNPVPNPVPDPVPDLPDPAALHARRTEALRQFNAYAHQAKATARLQSKARPFSLQAHLQVLIIYHTTLVLASLLALFEAYRPTSTQQAAPGAATPATPTPQPRTLQSPAQRRAIQHPLPTRATQRPIPAPAPLTLHQPTPTTRSTPTNPTTPNHPTPNRPTPNHLTPNHLTPAARPPNPPAHRAGAAPNPNPHHPARHQAREAA